MSAIVYMIAFSTVFTILRNVVLVKNLNRYLAEIENIDEGGIMFYVATAFEAIAIVEMYHLALECKNDEGHAPPNRKHDKRAVAGLQALTVIVIVLITSETMLHHFKVSALVWYIVSLTFLVTSFIIWKTLGDEDTLHRMHPESRSGKQLGFTFLIFVAAIQCLLAWTTREEKLEFGFQAGADVNNFLVQLLYFNILYCDNAKNRCCCSNRWIQFREAIFPWLVQFLSTVAFGVVLASTEFHDETNGCDCDGQSFNLELLLGMLRLMLRLQISISGLTRVILLRKENGQAGFCIVPFCNADIV